MTDMNAAPQAVQPESIPSILSLADLETAAPAETAAVAHDEAKPTAAETTGTAGSQIADGADGTGFDPAAGQYAPAFNPTVRTIVYVAGLVASIVSAGFIAFGNPDVGAFIGSAAALVASALGTAYNPLSVAKRSQLAALPDPAQPKHAA